MRVLLVTVILLVALSTHASAAGHRDAPLAALGPAADIADIYAFRSYDGGVTPRVTLIMTTHPFLEPDLGAPFDPDVLYEFHVDNDDDAIADLTLQWFASVKHPPPKKPPNRPRFKQSAAHGESFRQRLADRPRIEGRVQPGAAGERRDLREFPLRPGARALPERRDRRRDPHPHTLRGDLAFLYGYTTPIAPAGTPIGPTADLLRLNTGVAPTFAAFASRFGILGGDFAAFRTAAACSTTSPTSCCARWWASSIPRSTSAPTNRMGDGVNVNDAPFRTTFPYLANAPSGRDRRHLDPREAGCTAGARSPCPRDAAQIDRP